MVSEIGRWAPDFAWGLTQARQQTDRFECSDSGICDFDCMMVVHELLVPHPFDRVAEGLGRDIPISDIELHPLVERPFLHLTQNQIAQRLAPFRAQYGRILDQLFFEEPSKIDSFEKRTKQSIHKIGVL